VCAQTLEALAHGASEVNDRSCQIPREIAQLCITLTTTALESFTTALLCLLTYCLYLVGDTGFEPVTPAV
jgi:hypothetical protein